MKINSAAIVTIKRAGDMTKKGRRDIANWLRRMARDLEKNGMLYANRHTSRYMY